MEVVLLLGREKSKGKNKEHTLYVMIRRDTLNLKFKQTKIIVKTGGRTYEAAVGAWNVKTVPVQPSRD